MKTIQRLIDFFTKGVLTTNELFALACFLILNPLIIIGINDIFGTGFLMGLIGGSLGVAALKTRWDKARD